MATSRHVMLLMVACTLAALFIGIAEAGKYGKECPPGYKNCDHKMHGKECPPGNKDCDHKMHGKEYKMHGKECKTYIKGDVYNCGHCGHECKTHLPYTVAKCEDYKCVYKCKYGWANCDPYKHKQNGCETDIHNSCKHCGKCHNECKTTWKYGEAYCKDGECKQRCMYGYKYDDHKKCCVKYHHG